MKSDSVWVSAVDLDNTLTQMMSTDRTDPVWAAIIEAKSPSADSLPMRAWADSPRNNLLMLPFLFHGPSGNTFTREIAAPLRRFDLGKTFILPIRVFLSDRKTEVHADRQYYTMPRFEVFRALAPEQSPALVPNPYDKVPTNWSLPIPPRKPISDDEVAVHSRALDGPAIWHDPQLSSGFFFRGDVVAEMEAADVAKPWRLHRCRIVWPN